MKNIISLILPALLASAAVEVMAEVPEGYYDSLTGLHGSALRKAAKAKVRNHKVISYGDNTWEAFAHTDTHLVNGQNCWWDMYSTDNVPVSSGHPGMNIEHSVANSWWGGTKNDAYKDLFHLNPSNINANSRKSNYPLGEVSNVSWTNGPTTVGSPVYGQGGGNGYVYEPCDEYKGDFARVFMYMFTVYDDISWDSAKGWMFDMANVDIFKPWAIQLLLKWHRQDPVSPKEIARNEAIYEIQGNRNPYIDSPELAEYVWGDKKTEGYSFTGEYVPPVDPVDPDPVDPDPVDPTPIEGEWILVNTLSDINTADSYILIGLGSQTTVAMSTEQNGSGSTRHFKPTSEVTVSGSIVSEVPANVAVLHFTPSGAYYKASVSGLDGQPIGWLCSTSTKNVTAAESSSAEGTAFTLSIGGGESALNFGNVGTIFFNESAPRFTTYTSTGQKPTALYRKSKSSGIENIEEDSCETERIFSIHGMEVKGDHDSLAPGLYIIVKDGKARKVVRH